MAPLHNLICARNTLRKFKSESRSIVAQFSKTGFASSSFIYSDLEEIPRVFKHGVIDLIPMYKGKGRDPLVIKSYRGTTLTSVIVKTFEFILLERIVPFLEDSGRPQLTQTANRKKVSCSVDSIYASQEAVRSFTAEGDHVYSSFYDLSSSDMDTP